MVTAIEHKCVLSAAQSLQDTGFDVVTAPVDRDGVVDLTALSNMIDETTAIVSVMTVNNEVGSAQPISEIGELCRRAGALFHSDAAQALSVLDLNADRLGVDLLSLSGHKAYGPKGIGALFVRRDARHRVSPIMFGGDQQGGLRPGTLPTFLCVGLGAACDILGEGREGEIIRIAALRDVLLSRLRA
ncbi:cysteine desulfurase family protein, partial [Heyndrickxia sporothermodurans]